MTKLRQLIQWPVRLTVALVFVLGAIFALSHNAQAQEADETTGSIALTPSVQRLDLKAGESRSGSITVINDGTTPYTFILYSRPFSVKSEAYDLQFDVTNQYNDIYQWISFEKTSYRINPGDRIEVPYVIHTPDNAAPGGHYAIIFAETQPEEGQSESVQRKKRVGSIIQATAEGETIESGNILDMSINPWQTVPPLTATSRVENDGNIDFTAKSAGIVKDVFGNVKTKETRELTVYPGTIRKIEYSWDKAGWFGLYNVEYTVTIPGEERSISQLVLLMPRWLLIVLIALVVAGVGYVVLRRRNR